MIKNIEACEWLSGALRGLEVPNLYTTFGNMRAVREKKAEVDKLKSTFVRRASEFLRNYFASLVDFMISDKSYFSQRGQLKRPDHADLRYRCRTYARLLQHLKSLDKNCLGPLRKAYCSSLNLLLRREAREFANELRASTKASRNPTVWLDASAGAGQTVSNADTSAVSDAYAKMLTIFVPLLVDESSFFAHFMCFEVPAVNPPGSVPNGNKSASTVDDADDDDDLGIMDIDDNDGKTGKNSVELAALNECLQELLDGIQTSMLLWIGPTRLTPCDAYQCTGLQNTIFPARKLMQLDLRLSCLVILNLGSLCSLADLLMKLVTRLREMRETSNRWVSYHTSQDSLHLQPVWSSIFRDNPGI
ncbi:exocyst complex component SEC3A isoform X3 [Spinacia oleracea]|nr:exocyst complex component SEC3A-like isoform X3 [Spinacia oleracea]